MTIPSAKRKLIYGNLWLIDGHLWPKKARSAKKKKNIYASLMIFLDQKTAKRNIQENFWFIDGHLWPKEKNIHASLWLKTATKTIHKRVGGCSCFRIVKHELRYKSTIFLLYATILREESFTILRFFAELFNKWIERLFEGCWLSISFLLGLVLLYENTQELIETPSQRWRAKMLKINTFGSCDI